MTEFTIPETMRAHVFYEYGELSEVLQLKEDYPVPKLAPNEILVQVHATSVNPGDWKILKGGIIGRMFKLPHVSCFDFSGVVVAIGDMVTNFKVGEEVYGDNAPKGYGLAEYAAVPENVVWPKPKNLSFTEAAAIPLAGLTAWQALVETANVTEGQRVLIKGGSGGVGSFAIQIAKYFGAEVTTTCSERNIDLVKSLGADRAIDYTKENVTEIFKRNDFDIVFDTVGGPLYSSASTLMKPTGRFMTVIGDDPHRQDIVALVTILTHIVSRKVYTIVAGGVKYDFIGKNADRKKLEELTKAVEEGEHLLPATVSPEWSIKVYTDANGIWFLRFAGKVKPVIDSIYPFEKAVEAIERSKTGRARGKIVVAVKDD
ncbi:NADPH:quinone reductase [Endogone sp. FLAS-F59071]|nr:NADPH:quinone reductase [Endogone sp. FLAS-F59071]|eukprot:RUS16331.1 NADPH:quinone reductase [Endogone sp. FLAS-F59071]